MPFSHHRNSSRPRPKIPCGDQYAPPTSSFIAANGMGTVRDGWNENDLIEVINNYDKMHEACVREGKELTNIACARKMIALHHSSS